MTDSINPNLINNIKPKDIKYYMNLSGWLQNESFMNNKLMVFKKIFNNELFNIVLPSSEEFDDFYSKLQGFLQTLSLVEDRDVLNIIHNISKLLNVKL